MRKKRLAENVRLSEAQFRDVIARASQTSHSSDGISVAQLREIAAELEIDGDQLESALYHALVSPPAARHRPGRIRRELSRLTHFFDRILPGQQRTEASLLAGGGIGWWVAASAVAHHQTINGIVVSVGSSSATDITAALVMYALTFANAMSRRLDGSFSRYLIETAAMWGGFVVCWMVTYGRVTDDFVVFVGSSLLASAVAGWFVVRPMAEEVSGSWELTPVP